MSFQLSPVRRSSAFLLTTFVAGAFLAGCGKDRSTATADSALLRDLTLAATPSPTTPTVLGDTAPAIPDRPAPRPSVETTTPRAATTAPRRETPPAPRPVTRTPAPVAEHPVETPKPAPTVAGGEPASAPTTDPASTPASTSTTPAGGGTSGRRAIGSGVALTGKLDAQICSLANRPGDRFVATLSEAVVGSDGARIPAGTPILVEMATPATEGTFAFRAKAVQIDGTLIPIEGSVTVSGEPTERRVSKGGDKGKVVGGAVAGAVLGGIFGGGAKGTVIGAAGGAAAGTVAAARNSVTERCLPAGSTLTVVLTAPLVLTQGVP